MDESGFYKGWLPSTKLKTTFTFFGMDFPKEKYSIWQNPNQEKWKFVFALHWVASPCYIIFLNLLIVGSLVHRLHGRCNLLWMCVWVAGGWRWGTGHNGPWWLLKHGDGNAGNVAQSGIVLLLKLFSHFQLNITSKLFCRYHSYF